MTLNEQQRKAIAIETVQTFGRQQWFRDVVVHSQHPTTGEPTLEIKVNYVPIFERKAVIDFALRHNLSERFVVVDANGNPTE
jgi:hypothetical protein